MAVVAAAAFITIACKKDEPAAGSPSKSRTEYITAHDWTAESLDIDTNSDGTIDTTQIFALDSCLVDDYTRFMSNGVYMDFVGAESCGYEDYTGVWRFIDGDTKVVISGAEEEPDTTDIVSIDEHRLRFSEKVEGGIVYFNYKKK